jgi:hypothetical protein
MLMMQREMMISPPFMLTRGGYNIVSRAVLSMCLHCLTLAKSPGVGTELTKITMISWSEYITYILQIILKS